MQTFTSSMGTNSATRSAAIWTRSEHVVSATGTARCCTQDDAPINCSLGVRISSVTNTRAHSYGVRISSDHSSANRRGTRAHATQTEQFHARSRGVRIS